MMLVGYDIAFQILGAHEDRCFLLGYEAGPSCLSNDLVNVIVVIHRHLSFWIEIYQHNYAVLYESPIPIPARPPLALNDTAAPPSRAAVHEIKCPQGIEGPGTGG